LTGGGGRNGGFSKKRKKKKGGRKKCWAEPALPKKGKKSLHVPTKHMRGGEKGEEKAGSKGGA